MKKIKILLVFILLLIPCMVRADMGAPMLKPYDMVVVAPDGIDYYDYEGNVKGHLNKDDKITINSEFRDGYTFTIDGNLGTYDLKDLTGLVLLKEELTPEDLLNEGYSSDPNTHNGIVIKNVTSNNTALVYAEGGVDVKKGPSKGYDTVSHLDKNTTIKYVYRIGDPTGSTHIYVDSNEVKGWIDILDGKVLLQNTTKFITYKEIELSCTKVPKNTILSPKYIADNWTHKVLVEYGNCKDLYNYFRGAEGLVGLTNNNYIANAELDIYEEYGNGGEKLGTIPADASFVVMGNASQQGDTLGDLYVSYDGKKGWIRSEHANFKIDFDNQYNEEAKKEITIEEDPEETNHENENNDISPNPVDYTSMYVIIGLSIALIAAIIVILVNRKKNIDINKE